MSHHHTPVFIAPVRSYPNTLWSTLDPQTQCMSLTPGASLRLCNTSSLYDSEFTAWRVVEPVPLKCSMIRHEKTECNTRNGLALVSARKR